MTRVARFSWIGGAVAASSAVLAGVIATRSGAAAPAWALAGWAAAAVPGLVTGIVLARRLGTPGAGFVVALGTGILLRLAAVLGSLAGALHAGGDAYKPWLLGVAAGYGPMQLFEVVWFHRRGKELAAAG